MAQLSVTIVRADTGAAFDVDLPDDVPMSELLVELVKEMGLPRTSDNGDVIAYELSNKRTGDWVRDGTLAAKGIKNGDVFLLTSTFVAGGVFMILSDIGLVALGVLVSFSLQAMVAMARRLWGIQSARERAEALRLDAERRAKDAEDRVRLAELEIASLGGRDTSPVKRVNVRSIS